MSRAPEDSKIMKLFDGVNSDCVFMPITLLNFAKDVVFDNHTFIFLPKMTIACLTTGSGGRAGQLLSGRGSRSQDVDGHGKAYRNASNREGK